MIPSTFVSIHLVGFGFFAAVNSFVDRSQVFSSSLISYDIDASLKHPCLPETESIHDFSRRTSGDLSQGSFMSCFSLQSESRINAARNRDRLSSWSIVATSK